MKIKKLLLVSVLGSAMLFSSLIAVEAASSSITFTSTSAMFEFDNRPYSNNMKIDCYYRYRNAHGDTRYKTDTAVKNPGVYVNTVLNTGNPDWRSSYAEMTSYINGQSYGTISKSYN